MEKIISMLKESQADQLFVGMGSPKQDIFIYENMQKYQIPVSYSMGAALDFIGGSVKRAPKWMCDHGLEWLHRCMTNPKRLVKRYVEDLRIFSYYRKFRRQEKKQVVFKKSCLGKEFGRYDKSTGGRNDKVWI